MSGVRVVVVKNYLDLPTCDRMNEWVLDNIKTGNISPGTALAEGSTWEEQNRIPVDNRFTTRQDVCKFEYPDFVYDVYKKIKQQFNLEHSSPPTAGGKDGIVVSCCFDGADVFAHKDAKEGNVVSTLRMNILTSAPDKGGSIRVEDQVFDLQKGDMMAYLVSDHLHSVDKMHGDTPRIMWQFGALVPAYLWNAEKINFVA